MSRSDKFYNANRVGNTVVISIHITPGQFAWLNKVAMALDLRGASRSEIIRYILDDGMRFILSQVPVEDEADNWGVAYQEMRQGEGKYLGSTAIPTATNYVKPAVEKKKVRSFEEEMNDIAYEEKTYVPPTAVEQPSAELLALRAEQEARMRLNAESLRAGIRNYANQTPKE